MARASACMVMLAAVLILGSANQAGASGFVATLEGHTLLPQPCPDGAYICTEAAIAGIGAADYRLFRLSGEPSGDGCVLATAFSIFSLADGSELTLAETRTVCGPGQSLFAGGEGEYGNPVRVDGTWNVEEATGQFAGVTGSGTSAMHLAGARFTGTYASN